MKQALVIGCSHAAGTELGPDNFARANSYPALVAQMLGYSVDNCAIPGGSNDAMFRIFLEKINHCDIVIAAWSGLNRSETFVKDKWIPLTPGCQVPTDLKDFYQQWCLHTANDMPGKLNKIKNVIALNSLSPVPVINCESFWPVWDYQWPSSFLWPLPNEQNFWDWCKANNHAKTRNGHFDLAAHQQYAKLIVSHVNQ